MKNYRIIIEETTTHAVEVQCESPYEDGQEKAIEAVIEGEAEFIACTDRTMIEWQTIDAPESSTLSALQKEHAECVEARKRWSAGSAMSLVLGGRIDGLAFAIGAEKQRTGVA